MNSALRQISVKAVAILIILSPVISCAVEEPNEGPPNIVVLFADDLGYGDLSCYGHPTIQTPHLDNLAAEGIRLTSFYVAAPSCSPSRVSLLTGRYPLRAGVPNVIGPDSDHGIAPSEVTLAEALQERGYRTAAIGKWHLGHARPEFMPTSNGFDRYFGLLYSNDMIRPWVQTDKPLELYRDLEPVEHPVDQTTLTTRYTREAVNFIESAAQSGDPFFLYLAYSMVHVPIHANSEFKGRSRAGLFGDVVETIDWSTGQVMSALGRAGLDESTLVVFASDNGPWLHMPDRMFEGGVVKPWHAGSKGLLKGSKGTTYEGGMRVPGIFRWKGHIPAGRVSAEVVTAMDVFSTILQTAGVDPPEGVQLDGRDVTSLLKGQEVLNERPFYYLRSRHLEGVRLGKWKLRLSNHAIPSVPRTGPPSPELFDLDVDPSESYNLASDHPETVRGLAKLMLEFGTEIGAELAEPLAGLAEQ